MPDWSELVFNSLWLFGLSIILATLSITGYDRDLRRLAKAGFWRSFSTSLPLNLGVLLFCLGMALTANAAAATAVWLLCLVVPVYNGWRLLGPTVPADQPAPPVALQEKTAVSKAGSKISRAAARLVQTEPLWVLVLVPITLLPAHYGAFALVALPVLWLSRRFTTGRFIPRTPLDPAIALMLVMLLVSLFATPDIQLSLRNVTGLLLGVASYYALAGWLSNKNRVKWAFAAYIAAGGGFAVIVLLGTAWPYKIPFIRNILAALPALSMGLSSNSSGFQPNEMAASLLWIVPLALALTSYLWLRQTAATKSAWSMRLLCSAALLLTGGTMLLTQSRGAFVAFALALLLMLWLLAKRLRRPLALFSGAAVLLAVTLGPTILTGLYQRYGPAFSPANLAHDLWLRPETYWSRAVYAIEDYPFTGSGMDAYRVVVNGLYGANLEDIPNNRHTLNQMLQAALDLGLPGLVAYAAIWLIAACLVVSLFRRAPDTWSRFAAVGIGCSLFAYFVHTTIDVVPLGDASGLFFWTLLALLVGLWRQYVGSAETWVLPTPAIFNTARVFHNPTSERRGSKRLRLIGTWALGCFVVLSGAWLLAPGIAATAVVNAASITMQSGAQQAADQTVWLQAALSATVNVYGGKGAYRKLGQLYILQNKPQQANAILAQGVVRYQDRVLGLELGDARQIMGDSSGALQGWRLADMQVYYLVARGLSYNPDPTKQLNSAQRLALAAQLWPDSSNAWYDLGFIYQQQSDEAAAAQAFNKALALNNWTDDPESSASVYMAHVYLGHLLNYSGDLSGAYNNFQAAFDLIKNDAQKSADMIMLQNLLAMVSQRQEQPGVAIEHLTQALALGGGADPDVYYALSVAEQDSGQYQQAIQHAQQAITLNNSDGRYYEQLAQLYVIAGDTAAAKSALTQGLRVAPDDTTLQVALQKLGSK